MRRVSILLWAAAFAATVSAAGEAARAGTITAADVPVGQHSATLSDGTRLEAWADSAATRAATLGRRSQAGLTGFGVQGAGNDEIDHVGGSASSELLRVGFAQDVAIASLTLGLLFDGPEYGDGHETAVVSFGGLTGTLRAIAEDLAEWTVGARSVLVGSCAPGATLEGGSGCFEIADPFAGLRGDRLGFSAAASGAADESDYLVSAIRYVAIPEPTALGALGLAAALWIARRRRG
jgi:hypothetical protein